MTATGIPTGAPSLRHVAMGAALATAAALAIRFGAAGTGVEELLFGRGSGIGDTLDAAASETRPALYPAFVYIARSLGTSGVVALQTFLYFGAGLALFLGFARHLGGEPWRRRFAAILGIVTLLNPRVLEYPLSVREEALFIPALLGLLLALLLHAERPRLATAVWMGLLTGILIGVRPIGIAFIPMIAVAILGAPPMREGTRSRWKPLAAAVVALGCAVGGELVLHAAMVKQGERSTVLGMNLIAKLPYIVEKGDIVAAARDPRERPTLEVLEADMLRMGAFAANAERALTTWDGRQFFTNYMEFAFQLRWNFRPEVEKIAELRGRSSTVVAAQLSLAVIAKHPLGYAERVLGNFVRFLTLAEMPGSAGLRDLHRVGRGLDRAWIDSEPGVGFFQMLDVAVAHRLPAWLLRLSHAGALLGIFAALWISIRAMARRRWPPAAAMFAATVAIGFVAYLMLCAAVINVQIRYLLTVWPMTAVLGVMGAMTLLRCVPPRRRTEAAPATATAD